MYCRYWMSQSIGVCIQSSVPVKEHVTEFLITVQYSLMIIVTVHYVEVKRNICVQYIILLDLDCPIVGQEYNDVKASCPKTCSNPHLLCAGEGQPGCSCPLGQVIDEMNNRCVQLKDCPSKELNERGQRKNLEVTCFYL